METCTQQIIKAIHMNKVLCKQRRGGGGQHMLQRNLWRNMFYRNLWRNTSIGN
jgi:hypothetical protein